MRASTYNWPYQPSCVTSLSRHNSSQNVNGLVKQIHIYIYTHIYMYIRSFFFSAKIATDTTKTPPGRTQLGLFFVSHAWLSGNTQSNESMTKP